MDEKFELTQVQAQQEIKERAEKLANDIGDFLNSYAYAERNALLTECLTRQHRTLQQNFTRFTFHWMKTCASDDYKRDERNEYSHIECGNLIAGYEHEIGFPFSGKLPTI